jgi:Heterokaryon incompatibility protein (HET)
MPEQAPDYVILSHRWSTEECTFADMVNAPISNPDSFFRKKQGFSKVQGACDQAVRDGYEWIWIDSCCIDKSSSAELQESINSMWKYYERSNICYVYMSDVLDSTEGRSQAFKASKWFDRGWTLQELIAPTYLEFYASNWDSIGTKFERHVELAEITNIDAMMLNRTHDLELYTAAEKFSWAAHRQVTREEDETYSLLGLFHVNMPLLYGEGSLKAFMRLQEAIYAATVDHSIA